MSRPAAPLTIPPLISGGVMLSWRCTNACKHCLYRCSPQQPDEWMSLPTAERVLGALAGEPQLDGIHFAGGEATLRMDRLVRIVEMTVEAGLRIDYLETNGYWCVDAASARARFDRLAEAGLPGVLISASPYHNEFIPLDRTRRCIQAAREVFGPGGVFVWTTGMYELLGRLDSARTHRLEEFLAAAGAADRPEVLRRIYPLTPGGRVVEALRECFSAQPAEAFAGQACAAELTSTHHFHVDPEGNLFTGHCPGLAAADASDFHPAITPETHPVFTTLHAQGPAGLSPLAAEAGWRARAEGYVSKCDLCLDVRRALLAGGGYAEVRPEHFYTR